MDLRLTFDEDAQNYDRARPGYPAELYDAVFAYCGAGPGARALEIGPAQGRRPPLFWKRGTGDGGGAGRAAEPVSGAEVCRRPGLRCCGGIFCSAPCRRRLSIWPIGATAFHWLSPQLAYPRLRGLLRKGGAVALFWNHPFPNREEDETNRASRQVYRRYRPSGEEQREFCEADCRKKGG